MSFWFYKKVTALTVGTSLMIEINKVIRPRVRPIMCAPLHNIMFVIISRCYVLLVIYTNAYFLVSRFFL